MKLLDLCEPLFNYICLFNRSARKGGQVDLASTRSDIKAILADIVAKGKADSELITHFRCKDKQGKEYGIDLVLMFFVDFTVKDAPIRNAAEWQELAFEQNELAGDEKFFELLDDTLADRSDGATQRLAIFYTCMGLGFTGWFTGQPEHLRRKMRECKDRLRSNFDFDQASQICPEAYENVNTSDLVQPPGARLLGMAIALLGLIVVLFVANAYMYKSSSSRLTDALNAIIEWNSPGK